MDLDPGFFAGEVTAVLVNGHGETVARYLLDVAPSPEKSGRRAFDEMVADLRDLEPALLAGTEPRHSHPERSAGTRTPWSSSRACGASLPTS